MGIRTISLQESAEELGFSTIDEALAAGCEAVYTGVPCEGYFRKTKEGEEKNESESNSTSI